MVSNGQDDVQMGDMNNEDEEMEEGEIRGTPEVSEVAPAREHSPLSEVPPPEDGSAQRVDSAQVTGASKEYVRPHSPVPLPPWDDKLTGMLVSCTWPQHEK